MLFEVIFTTNKQLPYHSVIIVIGMIGGHEGKVTDDYKVLSNAFISSFN